jgi:plastocyanin
MRLILVATCAVVLGAASAAPALAASRANELTATAGPQFSISLDQSSVKAGTYVITVNDLSKKQNFHLTGPGVNKKTTVPQKGTVKWTVKLRKGTYTYVSDPYADFLSGKLIVT